MTHSLVFNTFYKEVFEFLLPDDLFPIHFSKINNF